MPHILLDTYPIGLQTMSARNPPDATNANGDVSGKEEFRGVDVIKRVAKSSMGDKSSTFSGNEPRRLELWDSIYAQDCTIQIDM
ncbi:hypothetical protein CYMTET_28590 [Cymbomonas tetramitiformis]|uniref:Uncharacterized protein n=1 Tax=Cymbomonas tetramitiformis TaxID=36881 RepID=A0AAE0KVR4_9CHLO|nr:hypothetical protein CYMTET_28590 [Cymbomonas tetramitiformis]